MTYDAVLFDNDGVLIDVSAGSEDRRRASIRSMYRDLGIEDVPEEYIDAARKRRFEAISEICDQHGIDPEAFWERREHNAYRFQRQQIQQGEKALYPDFDAVQKISESYRTGIVSNNQQQTIDFILDHFQIQQLFQTAYGVHPSLEGIKRRKPRTYYMNLALADVGTRNVLYVGDSKVDIEAAQRAGIDAAFLRREHRHDYQLDTEPDYEAHDLQELLTYL